MESNGICSFKLLYLLLGVGKEEDDIRLQCNNVNCCIFSKSNSKFQKFCAPTVKEAECR